MGNSNSNHALILIFTAMEKVLHSFYSCKLDSVVPSETSHLASASTSNCGTVQDVLPIGIQMQVHAFCYSFMRRPTCSREIGYWFTIVI